MSMMNLNHATRADLINVDSGIKYSKRCFNVIKLDHGFSQ